MKVDFPSGLELFSIGFIPCPFTAQSTKLFSTPEGTSHEALLQSEKTFRFSIWDARETLAFVIVHSGILFPLIYTFCCSGARRQIRKMKFVSHSDSPEIGARIVAKGFGLFLFLLFPKRPILLCGFHSLFFLWTQALDSQLSYLLSSSIIFQVFFFFFFFSLLPGSTFSVDFYCQLEARKRLENPKSSRELQQYQKIISPFNKCLRLYIKHFTLEVMSARGYCLQQAFLFMQAQSPR